LLVIAALAYWRGRLTLAQATAITGTLLVVLGLVYPPLLRVPNRLWWRFSHILGWINSRIILGFLFFVVLAPIGLWWRVKGKDPLARKRAHWTGWSARPARYRNRQHFTKMY
jgi:hypothetical protein